MQLADTHGIGAATVRSAGNVGQPRAPANIQVKLITVTDHLQIATDCVGQQLTPGTEAFNSRFAVVLLSLLGVTTV